LKRTLDNEHLPTSYREAISVSAHDDKVKRLLDGEIDEAEIAADPVLASLAERIFGLNIEPITPSKPSQQPTGPEVEVVTAKTSHDPMIEVIPGAAPAAPMPLPELPTIPKAGDIKKKGGFLKIFGLTSLIVAVANIFGLFGFLNSQCTAEKCTAEATRINWAGIHELNNELGWSMPFPEMGIPDYVAVACSILVLIVAFRRK
tara:strand:+ start:307 stop:915 length:609 start_codon:yes stop_codon:yes gene_type:complete